MRKLIQKKQLASTVLGLTALLFLAVGPAQALTPVTACGQTLSVPGGKYILASDLDCSGSLADGITITANNVVFHLAGHTLSSTDCDSTKSIVGIVLTGGLTGVKVEGGTVKGFNDGFAIGASKSRVSGMSVTSACIFGIAIGGSNNHVDTSFVTRSGLDGIGIGAGSGNVITANDISGNTRVGVDISNFSNDNIVRGNIINNNGIIAGEQGGVAIFNGTNNLIANNALNNNFDGIEIESPGNLVRDNTVNGSRYGIFITSVGSPSTVRHNTVLGSLLADMSDDSATCGPNTWTKNTFQTDLAGGVPDGGPGAGCIR